MEEEWWMGTEKKKSAHIIIIKKKNLGFCFFSDKGLKYQPVSCLITSTVNHAVCLADPVWK